MKNADSKSVLANQQERLVIALNEQPRCTICGAKTALNNAGRLLRHRDPSPPGRICDGSGRRTFRY